MIRHITVHAPSGIEGVQPFTPQGTFHLWAALERCSTEMVTASAAKLRRILAEGVV